MNSSYIYLLFYKCYNFVHFALEKLYFSNKVEFSYTTSNVFFLLVLNEFELQMNLLHHHFCEIFGFK